MSKFSPALNFLNEMESEALKSALESLEVLLKELEEKNDPEPIEMEIVNSSYKLIENLQTIKVLLRQYYQKQSRNISTSIKLNDLYK